VHPPERPHEIEERKKEITLGRTRGYIQQHEKRKTILQQKETGRGRNRHHRHEWRFLIREWSPHAHRISTICFFACIGLRGVCFWLGKISKALWGNILFLFSLILVSALILVHDGAEVVALLAYTISCFLNHRFDFNFRLSNKS
jgi:hypothetical protein